jgi:putative transcriptional regulator
MKPQDNISNSLRRHRLLRDEMTQQELADKVGVTRQTIFSIEKGRYNPSVGLALRLARALGVRVEDLFEIEGED